MAIIQNRITIVDSAHFFQNGDELSHFKNSFPVSLKDITCIITETVSNTNKPPIIANTISCFTIIAIAAKDPPNDKDPVSP